MGLLDSYAKLDDVSASTFDTPPANTYEYVVKGISIKEGSAKRPDAVWVIIEYILNDGKKDYSYSEFFLLPEDPNRPNEKEIQTLSRYLSRLVSLGLSEDEAKKEPESIEGLEGVLTLSETKRGDQTYTNVRNVRAGDRQVTKEPPVKAAAPTRRRKVEAVVPEPVEEDEIEEEADEAEEEAVAAAESPADRLALRRRRLQSTAATSRSNTLAD